MPKDQMVHNSGQYMLERAQKFKVFFPLMYEADGSFQNLNAISGRQEWGWDEKIDPELIEIDLEGIVYLKQVYGKLCNYI